MNRIQITKCEAEVMDVVWRKGQVTVAEVVDAIGRNLAYTTVLTTLRILEDKGIIQRGEKIGRAFTYVPLVSREEVRQGMLSELTERLFGGSIRSLVLSLINSENISEEDIQALKEAAEKLEKAQ